PIAPETFVQQIEAFMPANLRSAPPSPAPIERGETATQRIQDRHAVLLVVDDRDVELSLMQSLFDPSGYEVVTASNVADALGLARRAHPDLIVCDVNMPGGSGYDLLDALNSDPRLNRVPVVLITS